MTADRQRSAPGQKEPGEALDLMLRAATLLFANGQTTVRVMQATARVGGAFGFLADLLPRWGELTATVADGDGLRAATVVANPLGVDMSKVAATMGLIDRFCDGRIDAETARAELETIRHRPPVALVRFASLAAAGAAALGVIFGAGHPLSLVLIALSAGAGALARRWLAGISTNAFAQPFCAALLAGAVGAVAVHFQLSSMQRLIAVCPCMVLVPGPHLLNGAIDLARARIALGAARILYAGLIIVSICIGLMAGLASGGVTLPVSGPSVPVPLLYDTIAAGVAVAAYGTFFNMPWRTLPIPILVGMLAHAPAGRRSRSATAASRRGRSSPACSSASSLRRSPIACECRSGHSPLPPWYR